MKIQQNSSTSTGLDTLWSYERPSGGSVRQLNPTVTKARIRLLAVNQQGWLHADLGQQGFYDVSLVPRTYTAHTAPALVGVAAGVTSAQLDSFALYDAVLMEQSGSRPKIGTTYNMDLTTQATSQTPFVTGLSFSGGAKAGQLTDIPLGGGRFIPLGADALLSFSLSLGSPLGLVGITNANGVGNPQFKIPNLQVPVGVRIHAAAVTVTANGIENISNDHSFKIEA